MLPTPWFAPQLSPAMIRLMVQLGYRLFIPRGKVIYSKSSLFSSSKVFYVKSGFVAQAVIHTGIKPILVNLSSKGSFCGGEQEFYAKDPIPRKNWAATDCEVLSVPVELLHQLADRNIALHRDLAGYAARSANNERIGMLINQLANDEERIGVFAASLLLASSLDFSSKALDACGGFIQLPALPSRQIIGSTIMCSPASMDAILRSWIASGDLVHHDGSLWISWKRVEPSYRWLEQLLEESG